jgi:hypothetical protein
MTDPRLFRQVADLVDRLRDLPPGDASNDLRERFLALIKHLEAQGLIPRLGCVSTFCEWPR